MTGFPFLFVFRRITTCSPMIIASAARGLPVLTSSGIDVDENSPAPDIWIDWPWAFASTVSPVKVATPAWARVVAVAPGASGTEIETVPPYDVATLP